MVAFSDSCDSFPEYWNIVRLQQDLQGLLILFYDKFRQLEAWQAPLASDQML